MWRGAALSIAAEVSAHDMQNSSDARSDILHISFISEVFSDIVRNIAKFTNIGYNLIVLEL